MTMCTPKTSKTARLRLVTRPLRTAVYRRCVVFAVVVLTAGLAVPGLVFAAQAPAINAQSFEIAPGAADGIFVRGAGLQGSRHWHLVSALHYARRSLAFKNLSHDVAQVVHGDLWMMDVGAAVGWRLWTFEATLPIALALGGSGPDLLAIDRPLAPAFGDLRLGARRRLYTKNLENMGQIDLGALILWAAPTGKTGSWLTNAGARLDLMGLATWRLSGWKSDLAAGVRLRPMSALAIARTDATTGEPVTGAGGQPEFEQALAVGSEWVVQLGSGRRLLAEQLGLRAEMQLKGMLTSAATGGQMLAEVMAQADWRLARGAWHVFGGLGAAMTTGYGAAQFRGVVGFKFDPQQLPNDADGDGLDDRDDRCPARAEDRDGFQDQDGCPDLDNDGDGVSDSVDRCPLVPEDRDGRNDTDGCPDLDDDGDGIPDVSDKCPTKAEDVDGHDDTDGCPDPDNDGDGILDGDDLCPNAPENGIEPHDGCPGAAAPPAVSDEGRRFRIQGKIEFQRGSPVLTAVARKRLDALAVYVRKHKELTAFEVSVFTDNNGDSEALRVLSQRRANAVKAYWQPRAGLRPDQVRAVGRGQQQPIADNGTLAGRSRNRRVEIRITKRTAPPPSGKVSSPSAAPAATPAGPTPAAEAPSKPRPAAKSGAVGTPKATAKPRAAPEPRAVTKPHAADQPKGRAQTPPPAAPAAPAAKDSKKRGSAPAQPGADAAPQGPPPARPSNGAGGPPPARPTP
ncbi:MAG: OmpA family protein [Myxococcales bacterium]|nr:OmpA family protein [Myxococcales bacterium]